MVGITVLTGARELEGTGVSLGALSKVVVGSGMVLGVLLGLGSEVWVRVEVAGSVRTAAAGDVAASPDAPG